MNLWQKSSEHPFPSILLVFADNKLKEYMMTFIPKYLDEEMTDDIAFYLATKEKIEQTKLNSSVWDVPSIEID